MSQMFCIMADKTDWKVPIGPTHIIGKDYSILPVAIGTAETLLDRPEYCAIWVNEKTHKKINHNNGYVFIHDINNNIKIGDISTKICESMEKTLNTKVDDITLLHRDHLHIYYNTFNKEK